MKRIIGYGFLLWLIPFIVGFLAFPLKKSNSPLFETIMPVTLSLCVVCFSILLYRKQEPSPSKGLQIGIIWFLISVLIDLGLFMKGPMAMPFTTYMQDIGFTYLIYPIVTTGFAILINKKKLSAGEEESV